MPAPLAQVAVRAVGLNFRDVLNCLGMYPGTRGPPAPTARAASSRSAQARAAGPPAARVPRETLALRLRHATSAHMPSCSLLSAQEEVHCYVLPIACLILCPPPCVHCDPLT